MDSASGKAAAITAPATAPAVATEAYVQWIGELKRRYRGAQIKAAVALNRELLRFYWNLGRDIALRFEAESGYGTAFFERLSADLAREIPEARGFSPANLRYCRRFWLLYSGGGEPPAGNLQQLVEELARIPWGHHVRIIDRCDGDRDRALFYVRKTLANNWSRNVLLHFIETDLFAREGRALTNFSDTLPAPRSDLARETLKDPYKLDFVDLAQEASERDLENALVSHVTEFLVELGTGFAYVGRQIRLQVGNEEFRVDLLFYHLKLRCYVVVELKAGNFRPEHLGQLGFYMTAVDEQLKDDRDAPTIGLLLCRTKDKVVAEYALRGEQRPMGISQYELVQAASARFSSALPSIEEIERGLSPIPPAPAPESAP